MVLAGRVQKDVRWARGGGEKTREEVSIKSTGSEDMEEEIEIRVESSRKRCARNRILSA
jgi:hypothetical protein